MYKCTVCQFYDAEKILIAHSQLYSTRSFMGLRFFQLLLQQSNRPFHLILVMPRGSPIAILLNRLRELRQIPLA